MKFILPLFFLFVAACAHEPIRKPATVSGEVDPSLYVLEGDEVVFTATVKLSNALMSDTIVSWTAPVTKDICGTTHRRVVAHCFPKEFASTGTVCPYPYEAGTTGSLCVLSEQLVDWMNGPQGQASQYPAPFNNGGSYYNYGQINRYYNYGQNSPSIPDTFPVPECSLSASVPKRSEMIVAKGRRLTVRVDQDRGQGIYSLMNGDKPTGLLVSCRGFAWLPIVALEKTTPLKLNLKKHNQLKPIKINSQVPESAPLTPIDI